MDEDELRIGKKSRPSDPAVALALEAVRLQREILVEVREKAARRVGKNAEANKTKDDNKAQSGTPDGKAAGGAKRPSPQRMASAPSPSKTILDVKA